MKEPGHLCLCKADVQGWDIIWGVFEFVYLHVSFTVLCCGPLPHVLSGLIQIHSVSLFTLPSGLIDWMIKGNYL